MHAVDLAAAHAGRLAALRASTGLKMPDAVVLLTAEVSGAALATFDERLAAAAVGQGVLLYPTAAGPPTVD
ncbi:hypothetical protein GCM10010174_88910 [Kutzneria viridogrisea]|uniref:Nucleic acid-binding protein n=1 Tax=Kutzneria viridogrisea TaxID=47990 RepID=A0ABR6BIV7_9PSEU|nr:putative nucleic acid-binding protein [Kutzneria viridogrisea]